MDTAVLRGKSHRFNGAIKSQWSKLTDDDLERIEGDTEKLIGTVQERYGFARDRAKRHVDEFINRQPEIP